MFVIFEGVDGGGKSSLANDLENEIRARWSDSIIDVRHCGPLKRDPLEEYVLDVEDYRPGIGTHIVADRWHWGERVYGPLYRDKTELIKPKWRWTELFLASRGAITIHVTNRPATIKGRLEQRGEDFLKPEDIQHVLDEYFKVKNDAITGDVTVTADGSTSLAISTIISRAKELETDAALLDDWPNYIGPLRPNVLLFGDKRGGEAPYDTILPFMPKSSSSGTFLLSHLPEPFWRTTGLVNANETDNPEGLIKALGHPLLVALGREASDTLLDRDIEHAVAPHPQRIRRFHSKRGKEYGELIADVARTERSALSWPS